MVDEQVTREPAGLLTNPLVRRLAIALAAKVLLLVVAFGLIYALVL